MGIKCAAKTGLLQMMGDMDAKSPAKYAKDYFLEAILELYQQNRIRLWGVLIPV